MASLFEPYAPRHDDGLRTPRAESLHIDLAVAEDERAIAELIAQREAEDPQRAGDRVRRWLAAPAEVQRTFVARLENTVVGFARACRVSNTPDQTTASQRVPEGWYLMGLIVAPPIRRQGVGITLTRYRLDWLAGRTDEVFYFANSKNLASIDLHQRCGFVPVRENFTFPGASFSAGGHGVLYRASLCRQAT